MKVLKVAYGIVYESDEYKEIVQFENISLFTDLKEATEKFYEHMSAEFKAMNEQEELEQDDFVDYMVEYTAMEDNLPCYSFYSADHYRGHIFSMYIMRFNIK